MASVQFYHLTATPLERALPKLVEKAYSAGFRTLLVAENDARVEQLNQLLWTYDPGSFLPHGSVKEGEAAKQPILLSTSIETPNDAKLLLVTDGRTPSAPEKFERILDMFDGNNAESVEKARARWKQYKDSGHEISYMRQTSAGGWEKAA